MKKSGLIASALLLAATIWTCVFLSYHILAYGGIEAAWLAATQTMAKTKAVVTQACDAAAGNQGTDHVAWTAATKTYTATIHSRCPAPIQGFDLWYLVRDPKIFVVGQSPDRITGDAIFFSCNAVAAAAIPFGNAYRAKGRRPV